MGCGFINRLMFYGMSVLIMSCYILPQMQVFVDTVTLAFLSLTFSIIFIFPYNRKKITPIIIGITPYALLMFIVAIPFQLVRGLLYPCYLFWNFIFPALLCAEVIRRKEYRWALGILFISFIVFCFVMVNTYDYLSIDEAIMRSMTSGNHEEEFYNSMKLQGIGGYGIAYSAGMFTTFFASMILYVKRIKSSKMICLIFFLFFVIFAWFSYKAQFTTLIVITIISVGISLLNFSNKFSWRFFLLILFCVFFFAMPYIIQILIQDNIDNSIGAHLREVYARYWGSGIVEDDIRATYRSICLNYFQNSPIWGQNTTGEVSWIYSHSHSSLLSIMLATGLIGLYSYYSSLYKAYRLVSNNSILSVKIIFRSQISYFVMLSYFNSSMAIELYWNLFLMIPLSIYLFDFYLCKR